MRDVLHSDVLVKGGGPGDVRVDRRLAEGRAVDRLVLRVVEAVVVLDFSNAVTKIEGLEALRSAFVLLVVVFLILFLARVVRGLVVEARVISLRDTREKRLVTDKSGGHNLLEGAQRLRRALYAGLACKARGAREVRVLLGSGQAREERSTGALERERDKLPLAGVPCVLRLANRGVGDERLEVVDAVALRVRRIPAFPLAGATTTLLLVVARWGVLLLLLLLARTLAALLLLLVALLLRVEGAVAVVALDGGDLVRVAAVAVAVLALVTAAGLLVLPRVDRRLANLAGGDGRDPGSLSSHL